MNREILQENIDLTLGTIKLLKGIKNKTEDDFKTIIILQESLTDLLIQLHAPQCFNACFFNKRNIA